MPLIQVKLIDGVFTATQKQEIIERLTEAMVAIEGEELAIGHVVPGPGGRQRRVGLRRPDPTADDVKALARGGVAAS